MSYKKPVQALLGRTIADRCLCAMGIREGKEEGYSRWRVVAKLIVLGSTDLDARIKYALAPMMTLCKQRYLAKGMHSSAFEMRCYKCPDLEEV